VNRRIEDQERLTRIRALARLMDTAWVIPGTRIQVGLDSLMGLIPGFGDMVSSLVSGYILLESARLGAPGSLLFRMLFNVIVDSLSGTVPLAGDVFDVFWRSNARNIALLEHHLEDPTAARRSNVRFAAIVLILGFVFIAAFAFLMAALFLMFVRLLGVQL
jgi:hypothetical protein